MRQIIPLPHQSRVLHDLTAQPIEFFMKEVEVSDSNTWWPLSQSFMFPIFRSFIQPFFYSPIPSFLHSRCCTNTWGKAYLITTFPSLSQFSDSSNTCRASSLSTGPCCMYVGIGGVVYSTTFVPFSLQGLEGSPYYRFEDIVKMFQKVVSETVCVTLA